MGSRGHAQLQTRVSHVPAVQMHGAVVARVLADDLRDVSWQVCAALMPATLGNSLSTPTADRPGSNYGFDEACRAWHTRMRIRGMFCVTFAQGAFTEIASEFLCSQMLCRRMRPLSWYRHFVKRLCM